MLSSTNATKMSLDLFLQFIASSSFTLPMASISFVIVELRSSPNFWPFPSLNMPLPSGSRRGVHVRHQTSPSCNTAENLQNFALSSEKKDDSNTSYFYCFWLQSQPWQVPTNLQRLRRKRGKIAGVQVFVTRFTVEDITTSRMVTRNAKVQVETKLSENGTIEWISGNYNNLRSWNSRFSLFSSSKR